MAELERATRGQAFRLDTEAGPVFFVPALWEFAGHSGGRMGNNEKAHDSQPWWSKLPLPEWYVAVRRKHADRDAKRLRDRDAKRLRAVA
jgi:hypothetical protein